MTHDPPTHTLFDPPLSRATAPASSFRAGVEVKRSGRLASQRRATFAAIRQHPGKSTKELADITGIDRYMLARRAPDLERDGLVRREQHGKDDTTWTAAEGEA